MNAEIRVLTGARAGLVVPLGDEPLSVGRHPEVGLRFSPHADLAVSSRHALLVQDSDRWFVADLGSRNGTFVNGRRITADIELRDGDRIEFGEHGPVVQFRAAGSTAATAVAAPFTAPEPGGIGGSSSTTAKIRTAVHRSTRRIRRLAVALGVLLVTMAGIFLYAFDRQRAEWERRQASSEQTIDSLRQASEGAAIVVQGRLTGLEIALNESQADVQRIGAALERARTGGNAAAVTKLRRDLETAANALDRQQLAAALDFKAIELRARHATAIVYVEAATGEVSTATAFAIRRDATLLTNRHAIAGAGGQRPRRVAVQFSDSEQVWPARVLSVDKDADLALVKVDNIEGDVPIITAFNLRPDTLGAGAPVAIIGFPLGGHADPPTGGTSSRARPMGSAGALGEVSLQRIELRGYGSAGASGSPILDANGEVVGVLVGGRLADSGKLLLAVPAPVAARFVSRGRQN